MTDSSPPLALSVVIPVYNRWRPLAACLESLRHQLDPPPFDVTVVDDGSTAPMPQALLRSDTPLPLRFLSQHHQGVSVARNHGIHVTSAPIVFFVDSDCEPEPCCLKALFHATTLQPAAPAFQACITCQNETLAGQSERLRLAALQRALTGPAGRIRWLNTAGFALRRNAISKDGNLFDPSATRAQDTLLLAQLIKRNELPLFVPQARVRHRVPSSARHYLQRSMESAFISGPVFAAIRRAGIKIHMSHQNRCRTSALAFKLARQSRVGVTPLLLLVVRRAAESSGFLAWAALRLIARAEGPAIHLDGPHQPN